MLSPVEAALGGFGIEASLADEGGEDLALDYALDEPLEASDLPLSTSSVALAKASVKPVEGGVCLGIELEC